MAKKQVNMRISEMTRDKLDFLSTYYGTQAEAIAVAVDRLYQETRYGYGDYGMSDLQLVQEGKNEALQPANANQHDTKIKVLLIEDVENISGNIQKMLKHLEMELVGTAVTCEDGIEQATNLQPHIVLLNRAMPGMGGLATSKAITKDVPYTRVIMTSVQGSESLRRSMLAGARDCLSRPFGIGDLSQSIHRVFAMTPYPA